jgi:hypothetical protein
MTRGGTLPEREGEDAISRACWQPEIQRPDYVDSAIEARRFCG